MFYVDTDNALGSDRGDIDDAFALVALVASSIPIVAVGCVFGNTPQALAFRNTQRLLSVLGCPLPVLSGANSKNEGQTEVSDFLSRLEKPVRAIVLGPLTNIASVVESRIFEDILIVGGNSSSWGKWPPLWPFEFNLTLDRDSLKKVFTCGASLSFVPLNVAKKLTIQFRDLEDFSGKVGDYLRLHTKRWFKRAIALKLSTKIPLWDLVAAMYVIEPCLFETSTIAMTLLPNSALQLGRGERHVRVVSDFDRDEVWRRFCSLYFAKFDESGVSEKLQK